MCLVLTAHKKGSTPPIVYQHSLYQLLSIFPGYCRIFTDGTNSEDGNSEDAVSSRHPRRAFKRRLQDNSSGFTTELQAILLALKHAYQSSEKNFLILTDSMSALQGPGTEHPLPVQIKELYANLMADYYIIFIWVPGHVGIEVNKIADSAANSAHSDCTCKAETVFRDFKPAIWCL